MFSVSLKELKEILEEAKANPYIIYYTDYLLDRLNNNEKTVDLYFDEIIDCIDLPTIEEKENLEMARYGKVLNF